MHPLTLSAGVIVIRRAGGECRYLVLRAYRYWDFPKGVVMPGEDPLRAACREVREETCIGDLDFRWGYGYQETAPYGRGKIARYYLAETRQLDVCLPISPELGRPEHHEFRWVSYGEARALLSARVAAILDWAHRLSGCDTG